MLLRGGELGRIDHIICDSRPTDHDLVAVSVDRLREVAIALELRRRVEPRQTANRNYLLVEFLTPEHKKLVLLDRTAYLITNVVVAIEWRVIMRSASVGGIQLIVLVKPLVSV